ncbi:hypothetical protein E4U60_004469 [Claviceps pazoutovae]|uniref:Uncharacterized protein n=1 Tax=Claviceps pazoutovae TaxID=1649127 RepID=A0A9P7SKH4_9HYPO|nr:hypothetical protein E4U60_004469 [Claviceps pazoutovae]
MTKVCDTFAACLGVASRDTEWATFFPVLRDGYEHAQEMGRRDEKKRQSLLTAERSTMKDVKVAVKEAATEYKRSRPR